MTEAKAFTDPVAAEFVTAPRGNALAPVASTPAAGARPEEGIVFMHQSATVQLERIQAILDGAELAAEQVQDKRIELLERGPEVTGLSVFIEFAITFALESPLAGAVLKGLTRSILGPRLRARINARTHLLQSRGLQREIIDLRRARAGLSPVSLSADQLSRELRELHEQMANLGSGAWRDYVVGGVKGVRAAAAASGGEAPSTDPSDTPGVAILALVQSYAASHRLSLAFDVTSYERLARERVVSGDALFKIWEWQELPMTLEAATGWYKRYFELLIWTMLLHRQATTLKIGMTNKSVTAPLQVFANLNYHVPHSLLQYWLYRFVDPRTGKAFAEAEELRRPGSRALDRSVAALSFHMQALVKAIGDNPRGLISAGPLVGK